MRKIIYYVATSIDGFIAGPNEDISGFVAQGSGVHQYLNDLADFDTVIMGRKTYEFGYQYGLKPGHAAYPHMQHYIFSTTLSFENPSDKLNICSLDIATIEAIKTQTKTDIYLCGGGELAAWLLERELIDVLKIKLNPLILGAGIRLFGASTKSYALDLRKSQLYDDGLQIMTYDLKY